MTDLPMTDEKIRDALRRVVDPEIGANIVDLGLIYRIDHSPDHLLIEMTMTSPACPMSDLIIEDIHAELARIMPETHPTEIRLVWAPPWHPGLMSESCRQNLGWHTNEESA